MGNSVIFETWGYYRDRFSRCQPPSRNGLFYSWNDEMKIDSHNLNDLREVHQVVEHGGFSAAERVLGISKSRLSRRLTELEASLGVRLLQRSTRKLALTEAGQLFYQHCQAMLSEAQAAVNVVQQNAPPLLPSDLNRFETLDTPTTDGRHVFQLISPDGTRHMLEHEPRLV